MQDSNSNREKFLAGVFNKKRPPDDDDDFFEDEKFKVPKSFVDTLFYKNTVKYAQSIKQDGADVISTFNRLNDYFENNAKYLKPDEVDIWNGIRKFFKR